MEKLLHSIDVIITEINNQISDKVYGINYLEKIKYPLIDKIKIIHSDIFKDKADFRNEELIKKYGENHLSISLDLNLDPLAKIKNKILNDYLCIVVVGFKSLKIYQNLESKESHLINLYPNTGIVLSKDTLISESSAKDTILLNIFNSKLNMDKEIKD